MTGYKTAMKSEELRLFTHFAVHSYEIAVKRWYQTVALLGLGSEPSRVKGHRRRKSKVSAQNFIEWMVIISESAIISSISIEVLLAHLRMKQKAVVPLTGVSDLRIPSTGFPCESRESLFGLAPKAMREFTDYLNETENDVVRPLVSRFAKAFACKRMASNRSVRNRLFDLIQTLDHFGLHTSCLKDRVEDARRFTKRASSGKKRHD